MVKLLLLVLTVVLTSTAVRTQNIGTGSIRGRIVDMDTGQSLPGVRTGSRETGWTVTDADGRYFLNNVPAGLATIWVQETNGGYTNVTLTRPRRVSVIAGQEVRDVDFYTRMDGQISGRVLDSNGEPLAGIRVSAVQLLYDGTRTDVGTGELALQRTASTVTDDRGAYLIENGIFAGRKYWILAQSTNAPDGPVSDAPADPQARRPVAIPTYYPNVAALSTATPVTIRSLEHRTNVDIRMLTGQRLCLEASLHAGSTPAAIIFAIESDSVPSDGLTALQRAPLSVPDGRIRICDLYRGSFRLLAASGPWIATQIPDFFGAASLNVDDYDVTDFNLTLLPPVDVSGEIVWDAFDVPVQGSLRVSPIPRHVPVPPNSAIAVPGTFSLHVLQMLRYGLSLFPPPASGPTGERFSSLYVRDVTYDGISLRRRPFHPGSGRLRIVVSDNAATLTIRVSSGQPAPTMAVMVLPLSAQSEADLAAEMVSGWTDDSGAFTATRIPPGAYSVLATNAPPPNRTLLPGGELHIDKTHDNMSRLLRARMQGQRVEVGPSASVQVALSPIVLPD